MLYKVILNRAFHQNKQDNLDFVLFVVALKKNKHTTIFNVNLCIFNIK